MARLRLLNIICLLLYVNLSLQRTYPDDPYYIAGVVEFSVTKDGVGSQSILEQVEGIREILEAPEAQIPDIIVFPEHILYKEVITYVPDPKDNIIPCEKLDYDYVLSELSCLARSAKKYIVININEKVLCTEPCANGYLRYNSNVVFDRNGTVVSRYRKSHLYWREIYSKETAKPEMQVFTTDFGVTFGHFICFDLMFYSPAQELVDRGVTDFIYPTYWYQEFPFLTALQLHQGWAQANNVNFLSAGGSVPDERNTGSGIFAGEYGALASIISDTPERRILIANVPKKNVSKTFKPTEKSPIPVDYSNGIPNRKTKIVWKRDYNVDKFTTELVNISEKYEAHKLCHNEFCCSFSLTFEDADAANSAVQRRKYFYRIAAFEGPGTLQRMENTEFGICTLMACTNTELWSCGNIYNGPEPVGNDFRFLSIKIKGTYKKREKMLVMPSTVDSSFEPLPVSAYKYSRTDDEEDSESAEKMNTVTYEISLNRPRYDIITFGLYGNYYVDTKALHNYREEESKFKATKNFAVSSSSSFLLILGVAVAVLY